MWCRQRCRGSHSLFTRFIRSFTTGGPHPLTSAAQRLTDLLDDRLTSDDLIAGPDGQLATKAQDQAE
jgi:hypothetical protein